MQLENESLLRKRSILGDFNMETNGPINMI